MKNQVGIVFYSSTNNELIADLAAVAEKHNELRVQAAAIEDIREEFVNNDGTINAAAAFAKVIDVFLKNKPQDV